VIDRSDISELVDVAPDMEVEVRTRFTGEWAVGFGVVAVLDGGVKIRRHRDGAVLPTLFGPDDLRIPSRSVRVSEAGGEGIP
jgi:hypothetical protein